MSGGARGLRKLCIAAACATCTGVDFYMKLPVGELLEMVEDIQEMQEQWQKQKS